MIAGDRVKGEYKADTVPEKDRFFSGTVVMDSGALGVMVAVDARPGFPHPLVLCDAAQLEVLPK